MDKTLSAYFLCAGYGQRLRPLTDRIPKPALTFLGRSALEINFRQTQALLPSRLICNTHHLYEDMEKPARRLGMNILYEKEILGTGGCLWNARHILDGTDRFLVHNGDLIHTIDLKDLLRRHAASGDIATLAGIFRPTHNTLSVHEGGKLLGVHGFEDYSPAGAESTRLTFAGIAIYERSFLQFVGEGAEDIKPYWTAALRAGHTIGVANYSHDASWYDFGTPQGLWEAAKFFMEQNKEFSFGYNPPFRETRPYVSNEAGVDPLPEALRNVLVYEEPVDSISPNTCHCVIGRDFRWPIKP
jgi:NDP-sugar pyrophosphorylase family protein